MPLSLRRKPVETLGESLTRVLREIMDKVRDIEGTLIVRNDGLVIASLIHEDLDKDLIAAMSASLLNVSLRVLEELKKGSVEDLVVKGEEGLIAVISINPEIVLAVIAKKAVNLGLLLLSMKKAKEKIVKIIEGE